MKSHFKTLESLPKHGIHRIALTMGIFDGVHLGHQKIISELLLCAEQTHATPVALTFSPHPRELIQGIEMPFITSLAERLDLLIQYGVSATVTLPFSLEFSARSHETFLNDLFSIPNLEITAIVVGSRWIFGKGGKGNCDYLTQFAERKGVIFKGVDEVSTEMGITSSTLIRDFIKVGDCEKVVQLLGRPFSIEGVVIDGKKIAGSTLETPTANIALNTPLLPQNGVYVAYVTYEGVRYKAVAIIGLSPTFDFNFKKPRLEVHLLNKSFSLYGKHLKVDLMHLIRVEETFDSIEALKRQITLDLKACKDYFLMKI